MTRQPRDNHLRRRIAVEAAKLMSEQGIRDHGVAKRKAAEHLGVSSRNDLPSNTEIQQALMEHQRIFKSDSQPQILQSLRETAQEAMKFLDEFQPRLVGPVLHGTAGEHSAVRLHVFAEIPEKIMHFLMEQRIPYEEKQRRYRFSRDEEQHLPVVSFIAGETVVELTVFSLQGLRQPPLSRIDGSPMVRASRDEVVKLMDESQDLQDMLASLAEKPRLPGY